LFFNYHQELTENLPPSLHRLPLMEDFYTIQGEGFNSGKAAYFIRLGGCDIGCVWCDVKDSWDSGRHPLFTIKEIVEKADSPSRNVVITGGEPLMHDLTDLCNELHKRDLKIFLETSGAYSLTGNWDWICVSPKKFKAPLPEVLAKANELKVVVFNRSDFEWAEKHALFVSPNCKLYLQPEWDKQEIIMPLIVEYVKNNPKWEVSLQTHKFLRIP